MDRTKKLARKNNFLDAKFCYMEAKFFAQKIVRSKQISFAIEVNCVLGGSKKDCIGNRKKKCYIEAIKLNFASIQKIVE